MADYKAACLNVLIDAYQPDIFTYFDDVASAGSLFMSPNTWRELIKSYRAKIVKAVTMRHTAQIMNERGNAAMIGRDRKSRELFQKHKRRNENDHSQSDQVTET